MNNLSEYRWTFWRIVLWACLAAEGLWFFVAFKLGPVPYPYQLWLMLLLWFLIVIGSLAFMQKPAIAFLAACANLVGCVLLTSRPGGVEHPWLLFAYYHVIDVIIVVATFAISRTQVAHFRS
jgi:hypothetical protein